MPLQDAKETLLISTLSESWR